MTNCKVFRAVKATVMINLLIGFVKNWMNVQREMLRKRTE